MSFPNRILQCPYCKENYNCSYDLLLSLVFKSFAYHTALHHPQASQDQEKLWIDILKVNPWLEEKKEVQTWIFKE